MCTFDGGIKLVQALWEPVWMLQIKNRTTIRSNSSTCGYLTEKKTKTVAERHLHPQVYCSIMYSSQDTEPTCVSING